MSQSPGTPSYPPARNSFEFPPPPVSRGWFWVAIVVMFGAVAAAVALGVTAGVVSSRDFPSIIENHQILNVITRECTVMTETVKTMPVEGSPRQQAAIISDQDQSIEQMLAAIRLVDAGVRSADQPTNQWLADWDRLVKAREVYAGLIKHGHRTSLSIPRGSDGAYIYTRMNNVWLLTTACTVPRALLSPYPKDVDGI